MFSLKDSFLPQLMLSYVFVVSGLIVNCFQLLNYVLLRPFNPILSRKFDYYLSYALYSSISSMAQWWSPSELPIYATDEDFAMLGKEHAFVVLNHKYDIDWVMGAVFIQKIGFLGSTKVVLKNELKWFPVLGWSWFFSDFIFVKRAWEKDRQTLVKDINRLCNFPKGFHYFIAIFSEGTRFTKAKHEVSLKVAREKGLPELKHHLLPRPKGFTLVASQLTGKIDYVYDLSIGMQKVNGDHYPKITDLKNGVKVDSQIYFRRIPMSSIPVHDEKQCADFLYKIYQKKDETMEHYEKTGSFESVDKGVKRHVIKANKYDLIVTITWLLLILVPSFYYLISIFLTGSLFVKFSIVFSFVIVDFLIKWLIGKSDSDKGSNFGLTTNKDNAHAVDSNNNTEEAKKNE